MICVTLRFRFRNAFFYVFAGQTIYMIFEYFENAGLPKYSLCLIPFRNVLCVCGPNHYKGSVLRNIFCVILCFWILWEYWTLQKSLCHFQPDNPWNRKRVFFTLLGERPPYLKTTFQSTSDKFIIVSTLLTLFSLELLLMFYFLKSSSS